MPDLFHDIAEPLDEHPTVLYGGEAFVQGGGTTLIRVFRLGNAGRMSHEHQVKRCLPCFLLNVRVVKMLQDFVDDSISPSGGPLRDVGGVARSFCCTARFACLCTDGKR